MLVTPLSEWLLSLRAQRSRTISTLMGIGWGTFAVVGLLAFGTGLQKQMRERAEGMGSGIVIAWPSRTTQAFRGFPQGRQLLMVDEDVLALGEQVPEIERLSPEYSRMAQVQRGHSIFRTWINGVYPDYESLRQMTPLPGGRFLNRQDQDEARRVLFLGDRIATQLFPDQDPVGRQVILAEVPFTVVGVMQPKPQDSDYGGLDESRVCIPASTFRRVFGDRFVDNFVFSARHTERTASVINQVYQVLGRRLDFNPKDRDALGLWDTTEDSRVRAMIFLAMKTLMGLAGSLTLLVGGVGVANLMFVLVKQRTSEIGLQLAVGARPRWILYDVMVQTVVLVGTGGVLGFAAAWVVATLVGMSPLSDSLGYPHISLAIGGGTVLLLTLVGLVAGYFPARRAARLDPVQALLD